MEFYFSDSNLAKDKFLFNLIEKDPEGYVDIEIFKSFNKIKNMTEETDIIVQALSRSTVLQMNSEKTKIKRFTPIGTKDFDACTLFVDNLPPHANHDWIKTKFQCFGEVDYINIPRFKSNKIKGFAFIEFRDPESVKKACEHHKIFVEESAAMDTENESEKNKTEKVENCNERKSRKRKNSDMRSTKGKHKDGEMLLNADETPKHVKIETKAESEDNSDSIAKGKKLSKNRKRKLENNSDEKPPKRLRESEMNNSENHLLLSDSNDKNISQTKIHSHERLSKKRKKSEVENSKNQSQKSEDKSVLPVGQELRSAIDSQSDMEFTNNEGTSKNRRKKKQKKNLPKEPLRVMSKYEWKAYRNKYLNLQRSTMSYIKKQILMKQQEWEEPEPTNGKPEVSKKGLQFQSGVIIKITLKSPMIEPAGMKEKIKMFTKAAFIDVESFHSAVYLRYHLPESAHKTIEEKILDCFGSVSLLEGKEEELYWKKIEEDRNAKFSTPLTRKKRGRDKIIAKASKLAEQKNKHVYYDE
ncbi:la-related protein 7 [Caerostris extrusa]|uniref:La-related protein 7 n=1 Tax=Caerostris extrusa TaxID=172846 RepID=A0AAV4QD84_CAEEX|nr:la-related protein 7 [Caerostris extrusa]